MSSERITGHGVLILERNQHMIDILASMLRHIGRRDLRAASDTSAAMVELNRRHFEIVLIDERLRDADGVELVRRLRHCADCQNRFTPVIMMSSAPGAARIRAARDAGVTEFLRKPFAAAHLASRIRAIEAAPRDNITASDYAGPDRRRPRAEGYAGPDRRSRG